MAEQKNEPIEVLESDLDIERLSSGSRRDQPSFSTALDDTSALENRNDHPVNAPASDGVQATRASSQLQDSAVASISALRNNTEMAHSPRLHVPPDDSIASSSAQTPAPVPAEQLASSSSQQPSTIKFSFVPIERSPSPFVPPGPPPPVKTFEVPRPPAFIFDALKLSITTQKQFNDPGPSVQPIYQANLELRAHVNRDIPNPETVSPSISERTSASLRVFEKISSTLTTLATQRKNLIVEKAERLRKEYLERHNAWMARCADLDRASQLLTVPALLEEAAAASNQRTTRRTAAVVGDTVRSDLEMEQIIATLGNEDMFDPAILANRNVAKIPDMIAVTHGQVTHRFDDTNHIVEDPASFYDPGPRMAAWTPAEEKIVLEQYAANPKQFGKIAEALPNKTARDCVLYYYLHKKKLVDFRKAVTQFGRKGGRRGARGAKKKGNALLADIRAHDAEVREESVDDGGGSGKRRKRNAATAAAQIISTGANAGRRGPRRSALVTNEATPVTTPTPEPEARPKRRRAVKSAETPAEQDEGSVRLRRLRSYKFLF